jgi:hypothetical protein
VSGGNIAGFTSVTLTQSIPAGKLLWIVAGFSPSGTGCGTDTISLVTRNAGGATVDTPVQIGSYLSNSAICSGQWRVLSTGAAVDIHVTTTNVGALGVSSLIFTTSNPVVVDATATGHGITSPITSSNFTTTNTSGSQAVICAGMNAYSGSDTFTMTTDSSYTIPSAACDSSSFGYACSAYKIVSTPQSSVHATFDISGNIDNNLVVASFK